MIQEAIAEQEKKVNDNQSEVGTGVKGRFKINDLAAMLKRWDAGNISTED